MEGKKDGQQEQFETCPQHCKANGHVKAARRKGTTSGAKKLAKPLREFLDRWVIPALVEKYLSKHKKETTGEERQSEGHD
jgi:hypothetical protein